MILHLLVTAVLALIPFAIGIGLGIYLFELRLPLLVSTGIPAIYFTGNLLLALDQQGLPETVLVGLSLGQSPAVIMLLTAITSGLFLGILVGNWWRYL
ncbi:hypothetical protein BBD46_02450 [Natrialba sp. SSL1]|nr:hypothetical protein BBD46_02450 [Natrialba sp. SSL1]